MFGVRPKLLFSILHCTPHVSCEFSKARRSRENSPELNRRFSSLQLSHFHACVSFSFSSPAQNLQPHSNLCLRYRLVCSIFACVRNQEWLFFIPGSRYRTFAVQTNGTSQPYSVPMLSLVFFLLLFPAVYSLSVSLLVYPSVKGIPSLCLFLQRQCPSRVSNEPKLIVPCTLRLTFILVCIVQIRLPNHCWKH